MAKLNTILIKADEHKSMSVLTEKRVNSNKISAAKYNWLLPGHASSFGDFTVLHYESHKFKRSYDNLYLLPRINHYWKNKLNS